MVEKSGVDAVTSLESQELDGTAACNLVNTKNAKAICPEWNPCIHQDELDYANAAKAVSNAVPVALDLNPSNLTGSVVMSAPAADDPTQLILVSIAAGSAASTAHTRQVKSALLQVAVSMRHPLMAAGLSAAHDPAGICPEITRLLPDSDLLRYSKDQDS